MPKKGNVSVVIPLYNKEKYIERSIRSVMSQTHKCFEIIVVNDGSTDCGLAKLEEIKDDRIRIINQDNFGESAARNKGITEAKYELIAFLDADDQWEPEFLENCVRIAEKYPDVGMISVAFKIIAPKGKMIYPQYKYVPVEEGVIKDFFKAALKRDPVCSSSVVVRKKVFDKLGGFTVGLRYGADTFMWMKIAIDYPVYFINKFLAVVYENADNRVLDTYRNIDYPPLIENIRFLDKVIKSEENYYLNEYIYGTYLCLAKRCMRTGDKKILRLLLLKAKPTRAYGIDYRLFKIALYTPYPVFKIFYSIWRKLKAYQLITLLQILINYFKSYSNNTARFHKKDYSYHGMAKKFSKHYFLHGKPNVRDIAITFDDGPDSKYTPKILDVLEECKVPATFFILGKNAEKYPEVVRRIVNDGHVIANHTWSHLDMTELSEEALITEMERAEDVLAEITGKRTALMRPPFGNSNPEVLHQLINLNYKVILWSADAKDWREHEVTEILGQVITDVRPGGILLFHSASDSNVHRSYQATVDAVFILIKNLRKEGYHFVTVDEIIGVSAYK